MKFGKPVITKEMLEDAKMINNLIIFHGKGKFKDPWGREYEGYMWSRGKEEFWIDEYEYNLMGSTKAGEMARISLCNLN